MTSVRCIDHSFSDHDRSSSLEAPRAVARRRRAAPDVAAKSQLFLVPDMPAVASPAQREAGRKSKAFRRGNRPGFVDGMFVVLVLGGAIAMWWSVWLKRLSRSGRG